MIKTSFRVHRLWLLVCLLAGACAPAATPAALQPVGLCYTAKSGAQVVFWYTYEKGLYQKYGLAPELTYIVGGANSVSALLSGQVNFCQGSATGIINAVAAGEDAVMLAGFYDRYLFELVVGPEIQSPEDLIGQKVAVNNVPGLKATAAQVALEHLGLTFGTDVGYTSFTNNDEPVMAAAVQSGAVAGAILAPPLLEKYRAEGLHVLLDISTVDAYYQRLGLMSTRSFLAEHRDVGLGVMRATVEAIALMHQDPEGTQAVLAQYLELDPAADAEELAAMYAVFVEQYLPRVPRLSEPGLEAAIAEVTAGNPAAAGVTTAQLRDDSFLQELEDSGFIDGLPR